MHIKITEKPTYNPRVIDFEMIFPDGTPSRYINAIRRVLIDTMVPAKYLHVNPEDMITEDKRVIPEYVAHRIALIPIHQSIPVGTTYSLSVINNHSVPIDVYAEDLVGPSGYIVSPELEISTLFRNEYLIINNITVKVKQDHEYAAMAGGYFAGKDHLTEKMTLAFQTYGTMSPRGMVKRGIDVVLKMLSTCRERFSEVKETEGGKAKLVLSEMDGTVPEMIFHAVVESFGKDVDITIMDHKDYGDCDITMNLRNGLTAKYVLEAAVGSIGEFFSDLLRSFDYDPKVDEVI
jgi:DNA-directed RNA polymerase alpha subunit